MSLQEEARLVEGALERARREAYGPEEFVDQHGFMTAAEILDVAVRAGVAPGTSVLDLCCGPGGPGRLITQARGCDYLGVDASASAVATARERGEGLGGRFEVLQVPPVPPGPFDVVLLLEAMLAFRDKEALFREVRTALVDGGRFAFTAEVGRPLRRAEREAMPAADTVWPVRLPGLLGLLERVGLAAVWVEECSSSHLAVVQSLLQAFTAEEAALAAQLGRDVVDETLTAHRLWAEWLRTGRVRKYAVVAQRTATA